eukprot:gb/GEZN01000073.1/.p1 GENE.gb/GEZN01000073.1/~~gb/GEZN01000073.1/.p1  ORF type:complete len:2576 (+),score=267.19 gb/GEZN01000073.1/:57-7784(+)
MARLLVYLSLLLGLAVSQTPVMLREGEIVSATVSMGVFDYYTIDLQGKSEVLTIWVTLQGASQSSGDPDLYLDLTHLPTLSNYTRRALSQGEDAITLDSEDYDGVPILYVGVYGWQQSQYSIVYTFESPVTLREGQPILGFVPKEGMDFFDITIQNITSLPDLTFSLTSIFGAASLYISKTTREINPQDPSTYQAKTPPGVSSVVVKSSDPGWAVSGVFYMVVLGGMGNCSYQLVVAGPNREIELRAGVAIESRVLRTEYLSFSVSLATTCDMTAYVTQISGGVDLFLADTPFPRADTPAVQQALSSQFDHSLARLAAGPATYHISVRGARSQQSIFRLLVDLDCGVAGNCISLSDGFPQTGVLSANSEVCYSLTVSNISTPISFSLTRSFGNPDIFITADGTEPTPTSYTWGSAAYGFDIVVIDPSDPKYNRTGIYLIKVHVSADTTFSLTATIGTTSSALQEGIPLRQSVGQNSWQYFNLRVPTDEEVDEIVVSVTPLSTGDPDLYISTQVSHPNQTDFTWSSLLFGADSITVVRGDPNFCAGDNCIYYIGVYGFTNVSFTVVATFATITQLQNGVPQQGEVHANSFREFTFQVSNEFDLTVSVSGTGSIGLYVTTLQDFPEPNDEATFFWSVGANHAVKSLVILQTDPNACIARCVYRIRVDGLSDSNFTIVAATASNTIPLIPGFPQREEMKANIWKYFSVDMRAVNSTLSIIATPISGDPDLYVSLETTHPDEEHYGWKSIHYGGDSINVANAAIDVYYIGVKAYTDCTFNILAQTSPYPAKPDNCTNPLQLLFGSPQHADLVNQARKCYALDIPLGSNLSSISLTLSVDYGDPDLYVTNDSSIPSQANRRWDSTSTQADAIIISKPAAGHYLLMVYAFSTCSFSLTATHPGIITTLQNGVAIQSQGTAGTYQYYQLLVNQAGVDITFTVTPINGDPDLYISTERFDPTQETSTWSSLAWFSDSITILPEDDMYCDECIYYVGVYDYTDSLYTLRGSFSTPHRISSGMPSSGSVAAREMVYYRWTLSEAPEHDLTISLTPSAGDPDLYVSTGNSVDDQPTLTDFTWSNTDQFTTSLLVIRKDDSNRCVDPNSCTYFIGVYGASEADYTLVAYVSGTDTGRCHTLQDGISFSAWVDEGKYVYFGFDVVSTPANVQFQLSALSGDPDMYISSSVSNCSQVSTANYEYESLRNGGDSVFIPNSNASTWWIAVYGFTNSTFTVTVTILTKDKTIQLVNGVPQTGRLEAGGMQYYRFQTPADIANAELRFSVSRTYGDPDLYLNFGEVFPLPGNAQYESVAWGSDEIDVENSTAGQYLLLIYGASETAFSVMAALDSSHVTLADGLAFQNNLAQGKYAYYRLRVDRTNQDLTITTTSITGDPDMYVSSTNEYPNLTSFDYKATSYLDDSVTIPFSELRLGYYYIAIYAWNECRYTIMASFKNEPTLQDGLPQSGYVAKEAENYYVFFPNPSRTDNITFSVTPLSGSAFLYISSTAQPSFGDPASYDWSSTYPSTTQIITIGPASTAFCTSCTFFVMVYGATTSNYSLVVSSIRGSTLLQEGVPVQGRVASMVYTYYSFDLRSACATLQVQVTPSSGDPDLYISDSAHEPTSDNFVWRAIAYGADTLTIGPNSIPPGLPAHYNIGVLSSGRGSSEYTIVAYLDPSSCNEDLVCSDEPAALNNYVHLIDGRPQGGTLVAGQMAYYDFVSGDVPAELIITVTSIYGDPDLYVRSDGKCPDKDKTENEWFARILGGDSLSVSGSCTQCRYTIGVYGWLSTSFNIVVSTGSTQLLAGTPLHVTLPMSAYRYFYVIVSDESQALVISATSLDGDPDLYVGNSSFLTPNASQYQYRQQALGSDVLTIARPMLGRYNIGVYAFNRNATFALTATNGPILLLNGQPHSDTIDGTSSRPYAVNVQMSSDPTPVLFSINPTSGTGTPVMYIRNDGQEPNVTSYMKTTANASSAQRYELEISPTDSIACTACQYRVLVTSDSLSSYSITFVYGSAYQTIGNGQPVSGNLDQNEWRYYRATVNTDNLDINIDVTVQSAGSEVLMLASREVLLPTQVQKIPRVWGAGPNPTSITISHKDPDFAVGDFYIGIKGVTDARYSLALSTGNILLAPGLPQSVLSLPGGSYFFYNQIDDDFTITLTTVEAKQADGTYCEFDLYITSDRVPPNQEIVQQPNRERFVWTSSTCTATSTELKDSPNFCANCTFFMGVLPKAGTLPAKSFTIRVSVHGVPDLLQQAIVTKGMAKSQTYEFYTVYVPKSKTGLVLLVETCQGNADIYVSQNDYQPDKKSFKWHSSETTKNDLVAIMDSSVEDSDFYISIYGESKYDSLFHITYNPPESSLSLLESQLDVFANGTAGDVYVTFFPASSKIYQLSEIQYTLYWDLDGSSRVMYSICGLEGASSVTFKPKTSVITSQSVTYQLTGLTPATSYKLNLVASDPSGGVIIYSQKLGVRTTGTATIIQGSNDKWIKWAIPVGILLVLGIGYLAFRNHKLSQELDIEMHDVPKQRMAIKRATADPAKRVGAQNYDNLLEEEESGVPSDYVPPARGLPGSTDEMRPSNSGLEVGPDQL